MNRKTVSGIILTLLFVVMMLATISGIAGGISGALFVDDFNDGDDEGWTVFQGDWQVINGEYVYGADGITDVDGVTVAGDIDWKDYVFEARFKFIEGDPQIYLLFRFTDYMTYEMYDGYSFQYSTDRWALFRWYSETNIPTLISIEPEPSPITPGEWYNARVEVLGNHMKCYINGVLKINANDSLYPRGCIGFRADCSTVAFDDAKVYAPISATIDIEPNTLNLKSKGKSVTAYIELSEGYDASDIDISTVELNGEIPAELHPTEIGDYDEDGILERMVKFDRTEVMALLSVGEATLTITGEVNDTPFEGSDTIRVIDE